MPVVRIDRFDDPRLRDYRDVSDAQLLRRRNLFVAEGRLVVGRLLESGIRVVSVLLNEASLQALEKHLATSGDRRPDLCLREERVCCASQASTCTGVALRWRSGLPDRAPGELLPGNLTSAGARSRRRCRQRRQRVSECRSIRRGVAFCDTCCDPLYRKAIRTSMGSALRTPYARMSDWPGRSEC